MTKDNRNDNRKDDRNDNRNDNRNDRNNSSQDSRTASGQKSSQSGTSSQGRASPAVVERYIGGIHFPADRDDLINQAKKNGAPSDVMHVLKNFEDKDYNSVIEIAKEVSRVDSSVES